MHRDADPFHTSKPKHHGRQILIGLVICVMIMLGLATVRWLIGAGFLQLARSAQKETGQSTDAKLTETDPYTTAVEATTLVEDGYVYARYPKEQDTDSDGLSDLQEQSFGSSPTKTDSDGDGISDRTQLEAGRFPATGKPFSFAFVSKDDFERSTEFYRFAEGVQKYVEATGHCPTATTWRELDEVIDSYTAGDGFQDPQAPNRIFLYGYSAERHNCFVRAIFNYGLPNENDVEYDLNLSGYQLIPSKDGLGQAPEVLPCAKPIKCYLYKESKTKAGE